LEIFFVGQHGEVHVAAELGGAVENAGLTAHEERPDSMFPESRKDFANRARDQGSLPRPKMSPIVSAIRQTAAPALRTTIPRPPGLPEAGKFPETWPCSEFYSILGSRINDR
jgi:hypothetical protein